MTVFLNLLKLLPLLIEAIRALEAAIPEAGKGALKLAAIRELVETSDKAVAGMWPAIEKAIAILVATFNKAKE